MELLNELPQHKPMRGRAIIAFTTEQVETYNVRLFGDKPFVISDAWHPDQHSVEEAVIFAVSDVQKDLKPGDGVLVDYSIFTQGRHYKERYRTNDSRCIYKGKDYHLYWCTDNMGFDSSEILARIDDEGKTKTFGDVVLVYPHEELETLVEVATSLYDMHEFPGTEWHVVHSSPIPEIGEADIILCEKGLSPSINFRGISLQYISLPYIYGKADIEAPFGLRLF